MARRYRGRRQWDRILGNPNLKRILAVALGLGILAKEKLEQSTPKSQPFPQPAAAQPPLPYYSGTGGKTALGIVKIVAGGLLSSLTILSIIAGLLLLAAGEGPLLFLVGLGLLGSSAGLLSSGIQNLCMISRFKRYCGILGQKTHCSLELLARASGKQEQFVRKDLKKMIRQGLFLEGHLDQEEQTLITSHETYRHFEESRLQFQRQKQLREQQEEAARRKAEEEAARKASQAAARDPKVQAILTQGQAFLMQIRQCNDAIPGQEISGKISRMEVLVQKIFHRLEADPEVADDLKKMMDYYLPTTIKLLRAYADMDAQPVQGETITTSKQEIEQALDTLNVAFEKLLDSIFQETALDVSSDISVLQTLLAQEGLTEDPFQIPRQTQ